MEDFFINRAPVKNNCILTLHQEIREKQAIFLNVKCNPKYILNGGE